MSPLQLRLAAGLAVALLSSGLPALAQTPAPKLQLSRVAMPKWAKEADNLLNEEKPDQALAALRKLPAKYQSYFEFHLLAADVWDGKYQATSAPAEEIKYLRLEQASLMKAKQLAVKVNAKYAYPEIDNELVAVNEMLKKLSAPAPKIKPDARPIPPKTSQLAHP